MVETIAHLDNAYGGAREYAKLLGLSDSEVSSIITNIKVADSRLSQVTASCDGIDSHSHSYLSRKDWHGGLP